ncbi:ABC transporter permease [Salinispora vitiensis]|uniref:ABC transporter permease n=1 Tax=Salinispora vitiensis TaxID=999544 RepID=UPI00036A89B9|nr:ABC transporter permease [Salinispora vitiensis]
MTTTVSTSSDVLAAPSREAIGAVLDPTSRPPAPGALAASVAFGWRALLRFKHMPEQLFDVTAFPLVMTLMFTYLFGGALAGSPREYLQFLLPGILVTSVVMITMYTGVGLNADIGKGIFDRFRTLPIWRPAALVGALYGDILRYLMASLVIVAAGLALGYRPGGGVAGVVAGIGLLVLFAFAFSWVWNLLGLVMRDEKGVTNVSMLLLFPLTFVSNVYVNPDTMPGWLQAVINVNPITHLVAAVRSVMSGESNPGEIWRVLIASAVLTIVFGSLTMRRYDRR